jgi:hypothetical protein
MLGERSVAAHCRKLKPDAQFPSDVLSFYGDVAKARG